jgi:hypothetical protein
MLTSEAQPKLCTVHISHHKVYARPSMQGENAWKLPASDPFRKPLREIPVYAVRPLFQVSFIEYNSSISHDFSQEFIADFWNEEREVT